MNQSFLFMSNQPHDSFYVFHEKNCEYIIKSKCNSEPKYKELAECFFERLRGGILICNCNLAWATAVNKMWQKSIYLLMVPCFGAPQDFF